MGITLSSLHVYSDTPIDPALGQFASFSEGWQSMPWGRDMKDSWDFAKKLSKKVPAPVLIFHIFDSDEMAFDIYENGKRCVSYGTSGYFQNKGIYKIPALVGYPTGYKRRISEILACADTELLTSMLEEFFGVALLIDREVIEEYPDQLNRGRGEALYLDFHKEEQKLRGKNAPVKATLITEIPGKIFDHRIGGPSDLVCAPGYYFFGYDDATAPIYSGGNLRTVRFRQGRLEPAEEKLVKRSQLFRSRFTLIYGSRTKVAFRDGCPDTYVGKTFDLPVGFFPLDFDEKDRLIVANDRGGVAYMNADGKVIAKIRVKGEADYFADGYLLTSGPSSFYAFTYEPNDYIRIYRLEDR